MNDTIFREYDIRGLVPSEIDEKTVKKIALGFGTLLRQKQLQKITVGCDVRLSSPQIHSWFIESVLSTGIDVIDLGTIASPVAYFSAFHLKVDGFCMITASHNPKEYNGFKLGIGKSTLFGDEIRTLKQLIQAEVFSKGKGNLEKYNINPAYISDVTSRYLLQRRIRVGIDPANATACLYAKEMLEKIGADVLVINNTIDGSFPSHHPDPTVAENMKQLSKLVQDEKLDLGIGFDGDSDRIGVVNSLGELIPGDLLTLIFAEEILKRRPGEKIIFEVKSSLALEEIPLAP